MDVLFIQFDAPATGEPVSRFDNSMGIAAALLRQDGLVPHLLTLAGFQGRRLRQAILRTRPRVAVVDIEPHSLTVARRTIDELARTFALPVVVIGQFATCLSERALSMPGTQALVAGEYELVLGSLLAGIRDGRDTSDLPGVWTNWVEGLVRGGPPELVGDLDALPFAERDLFDYAQSVERTGEIHFKAMRGCPRWCAYCLNDWYMDLHAGRGQFVRRRSVEHLLDEVSAVVSKYPGAGRVAFYDHAFIEDLDWMRRFAEAYPKRCKLPYRCHVRLSMLDAERTSLLAASGCESVQVQLVSGSNFIRDEVFDMRTDQAHIDLGAAMLRQGGIPMTAEVLIGSPYESEITIEETMKSLDQLAPNDLIVKVYYPTPGTRAAELCREQGWITGRSEDNYWRQRSTLDLPGLPAERINRAAREMASRFGQRNKSRLKHVLARIHRSRSRRLYDATHPNHPAEQSK